MSWLKRLFGLDKPKNPQQAVQGNSAAAQNFGNSTSTQSIAPERVGLNGEYDQSGLAKRVALAFDQDPQLDDINTLYVAQTGTTVVLKGRVPSQQILNKMITVACQVNGATAVETNQVTIG